MANSTGDPVHILRQLLFSICIVTAILGVYGVASPLYAQPLTFGSADDPREQLQRVWWQRESSFYAMGGLSLIAAQWRGAGSFSTNLVTRSLTARLSSTLRAGYYGAYEPDMDEWYDLVRLVEFARYEPPRNARVHLRAGLIDRMRLGTGHLVNFFNSSIAWDDRTVGLEAFAQNDVLEVGGFTDNILADGVVAGRVAVRPLAWTQERHTRTLQVGFNYVTDLASYPVDIPRLEGYNVDAQFILFRSGDIAFQPYASYAWYSHLGSGLSFGADVYSNEFLDLFSFRLRVGLYYNGSRFTPGYVGSFYTVNNPQARILDSDEVPSDKMTEHLSGVPLREALSEDDLLTELHILIDRDFEFWYSFRRHYGIQRLSEMHFRFFLRASNQLRLEVGIDRGGLAGFFSIFSKVDDLSALIFGTDYHISGPFWLFLRARYSYERVDAGDDHAQRYLVQRRFEPMTGVRLTF